MAFQDWPKLVSDLSHPDRCEAAIHVLAAGLNDAPFETTNLGRAISATSIQKVVAGVALAYQDWGAQPAADLILQQLGEEAIPWLEPWLANSHPNIRRGVLGVVFAIDPFKGIRLAQQLFETEEQVEVRQTIHHILLPNLTELEDLLEADEEEYWGNEYGILVVDLLPKLSEVEWKVVLASWHQRAAVWKERFSSNLRNVPIGKIRELIRVSLSVDCPETSLVLMFFLPRTAEPDPFYDRVFDFLLHL
ncbi:MAG: hypothetical protein K1Y36_26510 [Blastocatellia bacterium]|nr:hypothetical protein [Blastocatellia bacterium]